MHFGQLLRVLRTESGLGLRELARRIGISPSYLSLVENGKMGPPSSERITQIAGILHVSPSVLMNIAGIVDPQVLDFLCTTPEAGALLRATMRAGLSGAELGALARLLRENGRTVIERLLADAPPLEPRASATVQAALDALLLLPALYCTTRDELFGALAEAVTAAHPQLAAPSIITALEEREAQASTALGGGVALPHARLPGLDGAIVALARCPDGLRYPARPTETVTIVFLLLSAEDAPLHLELLSQIAELCFRESFVSALRKAPDEATLRALVRVAVERRAGSPRS